MSSPQINKEFFDFGRRMNVIAILSLIGLIGSIVGIFLGIGSIISIVMSIIIVIYFLIIIGNVKRAGRLLNNEKLLGFPLKFILGTIIRFVGLQFFGFGILILFNILFGGGRGLSVLFLVLILIGIALILIGSILRLLAWSGIETFFKENGQLFPYEISDAGRSGASLCKIGSIMDMTIILSIFYIGDILRIIGYFKLGKLRDLNRSRVQPIYQPAAPQPIPKSTTSPNYCPNCGTSTASGARYCPDCGTEIS